MPPLTYVRVPPEERARITNQRKQLQLTSLRSSTASLRGIATEAGKPGLVKLCDRQAAMIEAGEIPPHAQRLANLVVRCGFRLMRQRYDDHRRRARSGGGRPRCNRPRRHRSDSPRARAKRGGNKAGPTDDDPHEPPVAPGRRLQARSLAGGVR